MARYRRTPWKLNSTATAEAIALLGLKRRVRFLKGELYDGPTPHTGPGWRGLYVTGSSHKIYVMTYLHRVQANITLWHELFHAYQAENRGGWGCKPDGTPIWVCGDPYDGTKPLDAKPKYMDDKFYQEYWRNANERHAREMAAEFAPLLDLTFPK